MTKIIGVSLMKSCKVNYFDTVGMELIPGDKVVVQTSNGLSFGTVTVGEKEIGETAIKFKPVIRKATKEDIEKNDSLPAREKEAYEICEQKIAELNLDMRLINIDCLFDESKIVFYFTAEGRVDFRELVKTLAGIFKTRIELRQIGIRDEAKLIGGLGPCGRAVCCSQFLSDFSHVSIKMAKDQNLSLSPTKISGLCGRLMCCLNFENDYYEEVRRILPRIGAEITTPDGNGIVMDTNPLTQTVKVKIALPDESFDIREYKNEEVSYTRSRKQRNNEQEAESNENKKERN